MVTTNFSASLITFSALVFSPQASHCSSVKAARKAARSLPVSAGSEPSVFTAIESGALFTGAAFFTGTGFSSGTGFFAGAGASFFAAAGFDFGVAMVCFPLVSVEAPEATLRRAWVNAWWSETACLEERGE